MSVIRNDDSGEAKGPRGGAFYDDAGVFERYRTPQRAVSDPTYVMEEPALLEELGSVEGLRVVDLGCGDAAVGRVQALADLRVDLLEVLDQIDARADQDRGSDDDGRRLVLGPTEAEARPHVRLRPPPQAPDALGTRGPRLAPLDAWRQDAKTPTRRRSGERRAAGEPWSALATGGPRPQGRSSSVTPRSPCRRADWRH
jgi:hypothetical protein